MRSTEVIIVGGGPAGSSCARRLRQLGVDCIVLDRETFPRLKLCAGWVTPEVLTDLDISKDEYPHSILTFDHIRVHIGPISFNLKSVQHSIRRYEFDAWLLQRSEAPVEKHNVKSIEKVNGNYVIDGEYQCRYIVGAGGTKCPVFRCLFRDNNPRAKHRQAVALEQEFAYEWEDGRCHLWFFKNGLPGYSWYVPKGDGWLNVGIGGLAEKLKQRESSIKLHWHDFTKLLDDDAFVPDNNYQPKGYSYYMRSDVDATRCDNAFVTGDASGLATRDLSEGIGPAVTSGLLAAEAIVNGATYQLDGISSHSSAHGLVRNALDYMFS